MTLDGLDLGEDNRLTMKLNELVCPSCGLKCLVDASYTTCASCNTYFCANQSRSVDRPMPLPQPGVTITPVPYIVPFFPWTPPTDQGGTISVQVTDAGQYQVFQ